MLDARNRNYSVVNAFTDEGIGGNPAAIFPHAEGLSDQEMQLIAKKLNLVETVFIFDTNEPNVDKHLRFFTPTKEVPVAGHPTVAAWAALANDAEISFSDRSTCFQKTLAGIQKVEISKDGVLFAVSMQQRAPEFLSAEEDVDFVAKVFGIKAGDIDTDLPIYSVDTGLGHVIVPIKDLDALMRVTRDIDLLSKLCGRLNAREAQLFCLETRNPALDLHTRNLCPREGMEDPACGVGNGALGAYLAKFKFTDKKELSLKSEQGHIVEMPSVINIKVIAEQGDFKVFIGGSSRVMTREVFKGFDS